MNSGKLLEMFRWNIILSHTISVCTAKYKSSPRHHISLCGIENCFFCSLSGAIRFAVAKRRRRLRRRFSRGCATTNAIVLMTLPTALQGAVITAASGYIISTGALRGAGVPPAPPIKFSEKNSYQNKPQAKRSLLEAPFSPSTSSFLLLKSRIIYAIITITYHISREMIIC